MKPSLASQGQATSKTSVEIYEPVREGGEKIGAVYIRADMSDLQEHIRKYLLIGSGIMLGSLFGAGLFSLLLQRSISNPVNELAMAANAIKQNKDYSIRVYPSSNDEVGQLSLTFNDMLDENSSVEGCLANCPR